jgi:hypothetical protein
MDLLSNHRIPPPFPIHRLGASSSLHLIELYQKHAKNIGAICDVSNLSALAPQHDHATPPTQLRILATAGPLQLQLGTLQLNLHLCNCNHATMQPAPLQLQPATMWPLQLQLGTLQLNLHICNCNHATMQLQPEPATMQLQLDLHPGNLHLCNCNPSTATNHVNCNSKMQPIQLMLPLQLNHAPLMQPHCNPYTHTARNSFIIQPAT